MKTEKLLLKKLGIANKNKNKWTKFDILEIKQIFNTIGRGNNFLIDSISRSVEENMANVDKEQPLDLIVDLAFFLGNVAWDVETIQSLINSLESVRL